MADPVKQASKAAKDEAAEAEFDAKEAKAEAKEAEAKAEADATGIVRVMSDLSAKAHLEGRYADEAATVMVQNLLFELRNAIPAVLSVIGKAERRALDAILGQL